MGVRVLHVEVGEQRAVITPLEYHDFGTAGIPHGCTDGDHVRLGARVCESDEVHRWESIADEARQAAFGGCVASELHSSQPTVGSTSTPVSSALSAHLHAVVDSPDDGVP